ncbi:hypothetical protein C2S52_007912 [Perilla frutescens var. hirtella]|nr:hypothetical protein C2S52_007912 [Perilla frutescens var. hirtella]
MEMERAQIKVFEAAAKACITAVKQLMIDDPSIREALKHLLNTPEFVNSKDAGGGEKKKSLEETLKHWLDKKKNAMMVVASLIATMGFQVAVNPPGGVWQDDNFLMDSRGNTMDPQGNPISKAVDSQNRTVLFPRRAGCAVLARNDPETYEVFYIYNTIGFISSLSIIFLLMSGLPVKNRFFMWILMVITWIAISATALTYNAAVRAITPKGSSSTEDMIRYSLFTWIGLTLVILIAHVIRLLVKLIKTLLKALVKLLKFPWKCCTAACSPV